MYSVLRFSYPEKESGAAIDLGNELNQYIPGFFSGKDRVENRFSCAVSESNDWQVHQVEVQQKMNEVSRVLPKAIDLGIEVFLDIALEPEDLEEELYGSFDMEKILLRDLVNLGVGLTFTVYP